MKKLVAVLLTVILSCAMFTGCGTSSDGEQDKPLAVYSFSGENKDFKISNGVIVLTSTEEIVYGGNLEVNQGKFNDIIAYSVTYYIMSNNEKDILISNSVEDMTGDTIYISGETGKHSSNNNTIRESTDELQNNFYFELETTNQDGEKNNYPLQLTLVEITRKEGN